jgi:N-ethylmaleimide reductase
MSNSNSENLFTPIQVGPVNLSHRVVMAPLTRLRAEQPGDIPGKLMVEYYSQRASDGGLIIAEATTISLHARGYLGAPGLYTQEQARAWRDVTDAVHRKGGSMFVQLWHVGRTSHLELTNGETPVGASAVPYEGTAFTSKGWVPVTPNRALKIEEIKGIVEDYRKSAELAKIAGFDGVEIHAGNGYLVDQFLQDGSNKRTDAYGGSPENRARFLLEIVDAVISVWGRDSVGVRLSPSTQFNFMSDSNPEATFGYVAEQLNKLGIAYLHIIEPRIKGSLEIEDGMPPIAAVQLRKRFSGLIFAAGGFNPETAEDIIEKGDADVVVFGRLFISNPDLPKRIKLGLPLNAYDRATFYGGDAHGYVDYPFAEEPAAAAV